MQKDSSDLDHPFLGSGHLTGGRHPGLWNTHADFPVSHMLDHPVADESIEEDAPEAVESAPVTLASPPVPVIRATEEAGHSPFTKWLLTRDAPEVAGHEPQRMTPPALPEIPVEPDLPDKKAKKKKGQKKKKDKKKKKHAEAKGKKGALKKQGLEAGVVTDILAELAAEQGHTEQAIAMYRRLVNLHPEKTAYYLERIRILRTELSEE